MTEKEIQKQLQDFYALEEETQGGGEEEVRMC
jgi:hypothetical protein